MNATAPCLLLAAALAAASAAAPAPAAARLTVSAGVEHTTGRYGKPTSTQETKVPLRADWRRDRWRLRADLPIVTRVEGVASALDREEEEDDDAAAGSPAPAAASRRQSGPGDVTLGLWHTLREQNEAPFGIEVGARLKTPVAGGDQCLLTNGATDLSLEATAERLVGRIALDATLGWIRRGDPLRRDSDCRPTGGRVDLRNPFYASIGAALPLSPRVSAELEFETRQRLRPTAAPKREAKLGLELRVSDALRVQAYGLVGFSDASPDRGVGVRAAWRF